MNIRPPSVAGAFYPADPIELSSMIKEFLNQVPEIKTSVTLKGLVSPHAGYIYSGPVAAFGYKTFQNLDQEKVWQIVLLGPSHQTRFSGVALSGAKVWQTPLGEVKTSEELIHPKENIVTASEAHFYEHCLEVQIPFLQKVLKKFTIIPILTGEVDPIWLAETIQPIINDQTIVIASSDLSHYYPYEKAVNLDSVANKAIPNLEIEKVENLVEACGKIPILTLIHLAKKLSWQGKLLDYRNSGDTAGDKARVVGYGCYGFFSLK